MGNAQFMEDVGVSVSYFKTRARILMETGHTVVYVAQNGKLQGIIGVASTVHPDVEVVLRWLRQDGVEALYLVTGDTTSVARDVSGRLGFDDYRAALLPEDKAQYVEQLEAGGRQVVIVGDGVNDALALSKAGIGVAMGAGGAEVAVEAADIPLADSDLQRLVTLRQLSHQTLRVIEQNYRLAVGTNVAGVVLGLVGRLTSLMGGFLHVVHTLGILLNSSRLLGWNPPEHDGGRQEMVRGNTDVYTILTQC